ncbi:acyl-CoA dehydrogenase family protein [Sphingobium aquiterrae]|uniref:acyl-CoA dehydrogenase family protein n=1 Tax=Sphingobium aquiterrae TaxID=2038656 RepID=UPI0030175898
MRAANFPFFAEHPRADELRTEVRAFLDREIADRKPAERAETWTGADPDFSRKLGAQGWLGMTWPKQYGGHERSGLERLVVIEELLAAGAPVAAHWIADRQSGPSLLRFGTDEQRQRILPAIARGECYFCIGMSEPDAGSDLAAVRTRAVREAGGYRINGTKLWTTNGHLAHYMILLARTGASDEARHEGLSQFLVDLKTPGITVRPIHVPSGKHEFNEVHFDDALLPGDALLGKEGNGWNQVMSELAHERSGPERFLSSFMLMSELARASGPDMSEKAAETLGRLSAHVAVLRLMSRSVAGQLSRGDDPSLQAVIVKDLGAVLEQEIPEIGRGIGDPAIKGDPDFQAVLTYLTLNAPSFSLRGGTREILRGIIARGLGLR